MKRLLCLAALALCGVGSAQAACEFDIDGTAAMAYSVQEMTVEKSCGVVTANLTNTSDLPAEATGHNWVLSLAEDLQPVAIDGQNAGLDNDYIKPDDDRVIAHTSVSAGGKTVSVTFSTDALEAGGDYMYLCSFPGHWAVMQGKLTVT